MESIVANQITNKFNELKAKELGVFNHNRIENKGRREDIIFNAFFSFRENLESEINDLPKSQSTIGEIARWADNIDYWIKTQTSGTLSEAGQLHLKYRQKLMTKLLEIKNKMSISIAPNDQNEIIHPREKFTIKQQILLLVALGILDNREIKSLPVSKKARLFTSLLNRGEKSIKDHLTYLNKTDAPAEFFIKTNDNVGRVNELLKSLDMQEYR